MIVFQAYNYKGESLLAQDQCGEAIRSLQESEACKLFFSRKIAVLTDKLFFTSGYKQAVELSRDYAKTKGPGTQAKPDQHAFFRKLAPVVRRTLEKCERENGFM